METPDNKADGMLLSSGAYRCGYAVLISFLLLNQSDDKDDFDEQDDSQNDSQDDDGDDNRDQDD